MANNTEQKNGLLMKVALVSLALSFPIGLFILNAPQLKEPIPVNTKHEIALDLGKVIEAKGEEIAKIDMQILEARGELLKYEEMKISQLKELRTLYERIAAMLGNKETQMNQKNPHSK